MVAKPDLWSLIRSRPTLDPRDLAEAIVHEVGQESLDYRTRLLVRDALDALRRHWGERAYVAWLAVCPQRQRLEAVVAQRFDKVGFPSLQDRLVDKLEPQTIRQYLRELSGNLHKPVKIRMGGSGAFWCDLDVVDEVPEEIRELHAALRDLRSRYGLNLAHFQSHYLPDGWERRVHSLEPFGNLQVDLVDASDLFLSKLFSRREKDRDDLRVLAPQLDKEEIERRLREHAGRLCADASLRQNAVDNWFILYGEALPT